MKTILLFILSLFSLTSFAQEKDVRVQEFCNNVKTSIIEQDAKAIYDVLDANLKNDSAEVLSTCKKYGKYVDTHLLEFENYWGNFPYASKNTTHYGYRWSSSQNVTKCLVEIVCEESGDSFVVTQLIFRSKLGFLPQASFPEDTKSVFPLK